MTLGTGGEDVKNKVLENEGEHIIETLLVRDGNVIAEVIDKVEVKTLEIKTEIDIPDKVGSQEFPVLIHLENTNPYPVNINVGTNMTEEKFFEIASGESRYIKDTIQVNEKRNLELYITGDIEDTVVREIDFVEDAELIMDIPDTVSDEKDRLGYEFKNNGEIKANIPVNIKLYRGEELIKEIDDSFIIEPGKSLNGSIPVELTAGGYRVKYSTPYMENEQNFLCLKTNSVDIEVESSLNNPDELELDINLFNTGFEEITGEIEIRSDFTYENEDIEIEQGGTYQTKIKVHSLPIEKGEHELDLKVISSGKIIAERSVNFTREETVSLGSDFILSELPKNVVGAAGQELLIPFTIQNVGTGKGDCFINFVCEPIDIKEEAINLEPGEKKEVSFEITVPDYYESGTYQGAIYINDEKHIFDYQIEGYKLDLIPTLDKKAYLEGETAELNLEIKNLGGQIEVPLIVRVKHGAFDESRNIMLEENKELSFNIPAEEFNKKIFCGIYLEDTGRSLLLDVHNIYQAYEGFKVTTDKQRYNKGENVNVVVEVEEEGWLALMGPGDYHMIEYIDGERNYTIPLPETMTTGTYSIEADFEDKSLRQMIDILGKVVRFTNMKLDKEVYEKEDVLTLKTAVLSETEQELKSRIDFEIIKPDGTIQSLGSKERIISSGLNELIFESNLTTEQIGTHWIKAVVVHEDSHISTYSIPLNVGDVELNTITTEKEKYTSGDEIKGEVYLYGRGSGMVTILLDDNQISENPVEVEGSTVLPYSLSNMSITPGQHKVQAVYSEDESVSHVVETEFDYGIQLPDLIVEEIDIDKKRTADDEIKLSIITKNIRPAADIIKNIPAAVRINDELIVEYMIETSKEDAVYEKTILWDTGGFTGTGEITVEIDPENTIQEYDKSNNSKSRKVDIPPAPQLDNLPEIVNNSIINISGSTVPGGFVSLHVNDKIAAADHAEENGGFIVENAELKQGKNTLAIKVTNQKLFESKTVVKEVFVDSIQPRISIIDVQDGKHYNRDVKPEIEIEEENLNTKKLLLNGEDWEPGTMISKEGEYLLHIIAEDTAGNITEKQLSFVIDRTIPEIEVNGLENGSYYNTDITPEVNIKDINPSESSKYLNAAPYEGEVISEEGVYLLEIDAEDKAGNKNRRTVEFVIDKTPPEIIVEEIKDGGSYTEAVIPKIGIIEDNLLTREILLNGNTYKIGSIIETSGTHELTITAEDLAGNITEKKYQFALDLESTGIYLETDFEFANKQRVLVLYNKPSTGVDISSFLTEKDISYKACSSIKEFNQEIKTGKYNLYLLIDDSCYFNWMYDLSIMQILLKEKINDGHGLLYIYSGEDNNFPPQTFLLQELLGIIPAGFLSHKEREVEIDHDLGDNIIINGKVMKCWSYWTEVEGKIYHKKGSYFWPGYCPYHHHRAYPAILKKYYGKGTVYTLTFNPFSAEEGQEEKVKGLLKNIIDSLKPEIPEILSADTLFSLSLEINNTENR